MNYFSIVVLLSALIVSPLPAAAGERLTPRPLEVIAARRARRRDRQVAAGEAPLAAAETDRPRVVVEVERVVERRPVPAREVALVVRELAGGAQGR